MFIKNFAIVIPVLNEEENLSLLLDELLKNHKKEDDFRIIVVNDNSSDKTGEIAERFSFHNKQITTIHRKKGEGLHAAIITGLKKALKIGADYVITMDGDLSHSPDDALKILSYAEKNSLVVGSRFTTEGRVVDWQTSRKAMSSIARNISRIMLGIKTKDCSSGFKCYSKKLLLSYNFEKFTTTGYAFQIESVMKAEKMGFNVKEVPIKFKSRERGKSKVDAKELLRYFKSMLLLVISKYKK